MKYLRKLRRSQWLSSKQTKAFQENQLYCLLYHCHKNVPYYRHIFEECGVFRNGRIDLSRFKEIPFLSKSDINKNFNAMKSNDLCERQWFRNTSGGSTGEPSVFIQDRDYSESRAAVKMLFDDWAGYRLCGPSIKLWGSERDLFRSDKSLKSRIFRRLEGKKSLNAYCMSREEMRNYVVEINSFKPVLILAYAESIYELSKFIVSENMDVFSPKSIMTSAGTLFPDMRNLIEKVFSCPVFNRYGSREVGDIACETDKHEGLIVSALTHYVEIVRGDGTATDPGEPGEVIVTLLTNYAMPLIRYRIGDTAIWSDRVPTCGRGWPILKEVTGRVTDNFIKRDGSLLYGGYFRQMLYFKSWVKKYQIIQEDYEFIRFLLVKSRDKGIPESVIIEELKEIAEKTRAALGEGCRVQIEWVEEIEPSPSGKHLFTFSRPRRQI